MGSPHTELFQSKRRGKCSTKSELFPTRHTYGGVSTYGTHIHILPQLNQLYVRHPPAPRSHAAPQ